MRTTVWVVTITAVVVNFTYWTTKAARAAREWCAQHPEEAKQLGNPANAGKAWGYHLKGAFTFIAIVAAGITAGSLLGH